MKLSFFGRLNFGLLLVLFLWQGPSLFAQLRVVDYNSTGVNSGLQTVLSAIGAERSDAGIVKPLDILSLQEQSTNGSDTAAIVVMLNNLYGPSTYASTTLLGASTGAGTQTVIYNTKSVQLVGQQLIGTAVSTGQPRQALRAQFRPIGYDSSADFYIYASHYKASDDSEGRTRRNVEAVAIRADADALGGGKNIIYSGDFNIYRSSEAMWTTLTASGNGQAIDPINRVGSWHASAAFKDVHTQSPAIAGNGLTGGGIDDRFDFQLVTSALMDHDGLAIIDNTYHAVGNTNTHTLDGDITTTSTTALQARLPGYTTAQTVAVINALGTASDHLPVVADYQLPAMMGVQTGTAAARVLMGAATTLSVTVSNTASVLTVNGADELKYAVSGSGAVLGTASGTDAALGSGNQHLLTLGTTVVGAQTGQVKVTSSSQSVATGTFSQSVSYSVLDHAKGSFSALSTLQSTTVDFGTLNLTNSLTLNATLYNLLTTAGFTAGMDLDSINVISGNSSLFSLSLSTFSALAAGGSNTFNLSFLGTSVTGNYTAIYQFNLSDENLPGAQALAPLTLTLKAAVVPEPAPIALGLTGATVLLFARRRKSQA